MDLSPLLLVSSLQRARSLALAAAFWTFCSVGCQSWVPASGPLGFRSAKQDELIRRQAAHDAFPSPADVGLK